MKGSGRGRKGNYRGFYCVKKPQKWLNTTFIEKDGENCKAIEYLSLWERQTFVYMDNNDDVVKVGAETIIIPYICGTDGKQHRYMIDLEVHTRDGKKYAIEIKPKRQTKKPRDAKIETYTKLNEQKAYIKNLSKWKAAEFWAKQHGYIFEIWTEDKLKEMRIIFKS